MLTLAGSDIRLGCQASDKTEAITMIASELARQELVDAGYVEGMLAREKQASTCLGQGIAIPHGTTDTRGLVHQTGVRAFVFPDGVDWGDGQTVYLAIGIAAKSDEHLSILKQLTRVLDKPGIEQALKNIQQPSELLTLLSEEAKELAFDESVIALEQPIEDLLGLSLSAASLLYRQDHLKAQDIATLVEQSPLYLGEGIWLSRTLSGAGQSAIAYVTTQLKVSQQELPVKGLLLIAACDNSYMGVVENLSALICNQTPKKLAEVTKASQVIALLTEPQCAGEQAEFEVINPHGLHARPGAMLVKVAKQFSANLSVEKVGGQAGVVNAKSLMKVISLGVSVGDTLRFTADGEDATEALQGIGEAIAAGLGEEIA
ncbi:fused PTS fructose transporter subunit IIA/HPr protein [Dongshaea marina]|uniref:fused PTS fructose transporter subunit IIA/HPr protein n=1 Tax=Dongshaea marina TaxID=2047966 RepID=UPI000D3E264E|nr:fused PTS fructose transporter subunit IIA/HPr protein [Dongshaea marina]